MYRGCSKIFWSVPLAGIEPATYRLEGGCSIRLSYGAGVARTPRPFGPKASCVSGSKDRRG